MYFKALMEHFSIFWLFPEKLSISLRFCKDFCITLIRGFTYGKFLNPFTRGANNG